MTIYAIGDIHGQYEMLQTALARIEADGGPDAQIVFLGDYTDRGPRSREVIEFLIQGQKDQRNWVLLKGNHDRMFEWYLQEPTREDQHLPYDLDWLNPRLGGLTTLASYGAEVSDRPRRQALHERARARVPQEHRDFLGSLTLTHRHGDLFFCHAGVRPGVALADQSEHDLLWIRDEFVNDTTDHGALIVHGHTALDAAQHCGNRVNLDGGAGYGRPLTAAVFDGMDVFVLTANGRERLDPVRD